MYRIRCLYIGCAEPLVLALTKLAAVNVASLPTGRMLCYYLLVVYTGYISTSTSVMGSREF